MRGSTPYPRRTHRFAATPSTKEFQVTSFSISPILRYTVLHLRGNSSLTAGTRANITPVSLVKPSTPRKRHLQNASITGKWCPCTAQSATHGPALGSDPVSSLCRLRSSAIAGITDSTGSTEQDQCDLVVEPAHPTGGIQRECNQGSHPTYYLLRSNTPARNQCYELVARHGPLERVFANNACSSLVSPTAIGRLPGEQTAAARRPTNGPSAGRHRSRHLTQPRSVRERSSCARISWCLGAPFYFARTESGTMRSPGTKITRNQKQKPQHPNTRPTGASSARTKTEGGRALERRSGGAVACPKATKANLQHAVVLMAPAVAAHSVAGDRGKSNGLPTPSGGVNARHLHEIPCNCRISSPVRDESPDGRGKMTSDRWPPTAARLQRQRAWVAHRSCRGNPQTHPRRRVCACTHTHHHQVAA